MTSLLPLRSRKSLPGLLSSYHMERLDLKPKELSTDFLSLVPILMPPSVEWRVLEKERRPREKKKVMKKKRRTRDKKKRLREKEKKRKEEEVQPQLRVQLTPQVERMVLQEYRSNKLHDVSTSIPSVIWVATYVSPFHMLRGVLNEPPWIQRYKCTPPSHSVASQQAVVSFSYMDTIHTLPASYSENTCIETKEHPPIPLLSFHALTSLATLDTTSSTSLFLRTQSMRISTVDSLNVPTKTVILPFPTGGMQGLTRSFITVNTKPSMSTVSAFDSATVAATTRSLGGLGVRPHEFISRETLDDALKAIYEEIRRDL